MNVTLVRRFSDLPLCEKEIFRYAGAKQGDAMAEGLLNECINELSNNYSPFVCHTELGVEIKGDRCIFDGFLVVSSGLANNLKGCSKVKLFAATAGYEIDRLIEKYSRVSPSKALMFDAVGTEIAEKACDSFCNIVEEEEGVFLRPRFSPGYGDLALGVQRDIFAVLNCERFGILLNDSLLMHPMKSVTAFAGISDVPSEKTYDKCSLCHKKDCNFRGI